MDTQKSEVEGKIKFISENLEKNLLEIASHKGDISKVLQQFELLSENIGKAMKADEIDKTDNVLSPRTLANVTYVLAVTNALLSSLSGEGEKAVKENTADVQAGVDYLLKNIVKINDDKSYSLVGSPGNHKPW